MHLLNEFLVRFSEVVRGLREPSAVAETACRMLLEQLGVDRAHWAEVDWTTEEFVILGSVAAPGVLAIEGRFPLAAWEPYSASHRLGRAVVVEDTKTDSRADSAMRAATARMDIGADLAAPVLAGGRLTSVLAVKQRLPRRWTSEEIALVEHLAGRCWAEVERARAEAALRASEERYTFLLQLSDALRPLDAAVDIQGEATRLLRDHLDAGWCYYVEWDEVTARGVVLRDATRDGLPSLAGTHDVSDVPAFLDLLRTGKMLNVADYANFEGLSPELRARYTKLGFRSMLMATLVKQERLVASLLVGDSEVRTCSSDAEVLLMGVAERTWGAVERGRAEMALKRSEKRLRSVAESGVVAIAFFGLTGAITDANDAFLDMVGYNRTELERGDVRWDRLTPPEWIVQTQRAVEHYKITGTIEPYEKEYFRRNGERFWGLFSGRRIEENGEGVAVVLDITERKRAEAALRESEERQRMMVELVPVLLWSASPDGQEVALNDRWLTYTGQSAPDTQNYGWLEAIHPDDLPAARCF